MSFQLFNRNQTENVLNLFGVLYQTISKVMALDIH